MPEYSMADLPERWRRYQQGPRAGQPRIVRDEAGCWLWTGSKLRSARSGIISLDGRQFAVHRLVWEHLTGLPLTAEDVLVRQDGCPAHCCNPEHYRIGVRGEQHIQSRKYVGLPPGLTYGSGSSLRAQLWDPRLRRVVHLASRPDTPEGRRELVEIYQRARAEAHTAVADESEEVPQPEVRDPVAERRYVDWLISD